MKRVIGGVVALTWLWLGVACVPVQVKESCRRQMNDCLKNCQKQYHHKPVGIMQQDQRSHCEETCHDLCWRKGKPRKVSPDDQEALRKITPDNQ